MFLKKCLLVSSIVLAMGACSQKSENATAPTEPAQETTSVAAKGPTYRVGLDYTYAPYGMRNKDGMEGLDVDIMNAIAKDQNFQVEYLALSWDTLLEHTKTDKTVSLLISGVAADDLSDFPDFVLSESYMRSGDCIYNGKPEHAQNWQKNKIALLPEDALDSELIAEHKVSRSNIVHSKTLLIALQKLAAGEVQSVVTDCVALRYMAKNPLFKDFAFHESKLPDSEKPESADLGFGVRKEDAELLNKINTGLQNIKQSGELNQIINKWLGQQ